jgi:GDPmannose 4,6-dehydratase
MKALITGITGQDGSYLAEFLLKKGYEVYGMYRRTSIDVFDRLEHIKDRIYLIEGDLTDQASLIKVLSNVKPDEIYNLAAQSFVPASWSQPVSTGHITALGVLRLLEAIRMTNPKIKFYQASSSEMFGKAIETPQTEKTPFYPRSPYGVAKVYGYWITVNYRESYDLFTCNGILFNHESPRRGKQFVTRKITNSVAKIKLGLQKCFELGNLDAKRDWGFAGDYVNAMWLMLQQDNPGDYVISSGESHSVREFAETAFNAAGMDLTWEGKGTKEVGKCNGNIVVKVNPKFCRPAEVDVLLGDYSKAKKTLGWHPIVSFQGLVTMMVEADLKLVSEHLK